MGGRGSGRKRLPNGTAVKSTGFSLKPETIETIRIGARASNISLSEFVNRAISCNTVVLTSVSMEIEEIHAKLTVLKLGIEDSLRETERLLQEVDKLNKRMGGR